MGNRTLGQIADQCEHDSRTWFPEKDHSMWNSERVVFNTMGMVGEAGEVANLVKKMMRGDFRITEPDFVNEMSDEMADVLIYLVHLAGVLDIDLEAAWLAKRSKLIERWGHSDDLLAVKLGDPGE